MIQTQKLTFEDFIKIHSNEEERLIHLGSVYHNKISRNMWILLSHNPHREFYLKEMATILEDTKNPRLPIYEHHIKAIIKSGIVITSVKMHNKHKTTFYRIAAPTTVVTTTRNQSIS